MILSSLFVDTPYLIFQNHETQNDANLNINDSDIEVLRELAKHYAEIANDPINDQRKEMWRRLNDLETIRPLIWMNEVCWNEMNVEDELTLRTNNIVCQRIETEMRRTIYQWKHMQGDMIVEKEFFAPFILNNTGFGISVEAEVQELEEDREIASRHFHNQIITEEDIEKIESPKISINQDRTNDFFTAYQTIFDGILPVRQRGCTGFWFAPWDDIVFWMNADNVLLNLATEPELMHKLIKKTMQVYIEGIKQFEELGLLARNDINVRIGSGGYGYTKDLPGDDYDENYIKTKNLWGSATPQIFGSVSPHMHKEFGVDYEIEWLKKFGLAYYGCCEPLHNKIGIISEIPNLRKISISPWADEKVAAELMQDKYVVSLKPSPSVFASPYFNADEVKKELKTKLNNTKRCNVEIILKDISTVRFEPKRLWQWADIASEIVNEYD